MVNTRSENLEEVKVMGAKVMRAVEFVAEEVLVAFRTPTSKRACKQITANAGDLFGQWQYVQLEHQCKH